MPNRIIRESCRSSVSLSKLSHGAERMFWRLTTCADDYGRFQAESGLILANCYSRMLLTILEADISTWKEELVDQKVIVLYTNDGKEFGYFVNWDKYQERRAKKSKYPPPSTESPLSSANICSQTSANVPVSEDRGTRNVSEIVSVSGAEPLLTQVGSNGTKSVGELIKPGDELWARLRDRVKPHAD